MNLTFSTPFLRAKTPRKRHSCWVRVLGPDAAKPTIPPGFKAWKLVQLQVACLTSSLELGARKKDRDHIFAADRLSHTTGAPLRFTIQKQKEFDEFLNLEDDFFVPFLKNPYKTHLPGKEHHKENHP